MDQKSESESSVNPGTLIEIEVDRDYIKCLTDRDESLEDNEEDEVGVGKNEPNLSTNEETAANNWMDFDNTEEQDMKMTNANAVSATLGHIEIPNHILDPNQGSLFSCTLCYKTFTKKKSLAKHTRVVHSTNEFKCDKCQRVFQCKIYMNRHMKRSDCAISTDEVHQCHICNKTFTHKYLVQQHVKNVHSSVTHECSMCRKVLKSKTALRNHLKYVHGTPSVENSSSNL